jgi:bacillithiol system protein YtxJ
MNWIAINSPAVLAQLDQASGQGPVLIFKHSTRCSISATALGRLERQWNEAAGIRPYFLDLLAFRELSGRVAEHYGVWHESPQVLLIKNGRCVYHASHLDIAFADLAKEAQATIA